MEMGLWLSQATFQSLPKNIQDELVRRLHGASNSLSSVPAASSEDEDGGPADLSVAQMKRFLEGCSDRTKQVLRAIANGSGPEFHLSDITREMKTEASGLAGAWGGITKRVRTVLADRSADFVWWDETEDGEDYTGRISSMTYRSLRKALTSD